MLRKIKRIDYTEPVSLIELVNSFPKHLKGKLDNNPGLVIKDFEDSLAEYLNVKYCLCVNSATAGLMLAIKALGIEKEVIVPSYTFCGTVHPLTWNGLTPLFTDIDRRSFNLDPEKIKQNITKNTSAILAVHMYGNPSNIDLLEALARKNNLKLIFDSASAFGCRYKGKMLGGFGDLEVFSLQAQKTLNVLEGGFISTNQEALYKKLLMLRSQGNQGDGNCIYVGLNARMHPLAALMGKAALKNFDKKIKMRQKLGSYFRALLSTIPGISFQEINPQGEHNYQYMPVLVDKETFGLSRTELRLKLGDKGIMTGKYFHPPVHSYGCYSHLKIKSSLRVTDYVADNIVCLPFYSSMSKATIQYICGNIKKIQKAA